MRLVLTLQYIINPSRDTKHLSFSIPIGVQCEDVQITISLVASTSAVSDKAMDFCGRTGFRTAYLLGWNTVDTAEYFLAVHTAAAAAAAAARSHVFLESDYKLEVLEVTAGFLSIAHAEVVVLDLDVLGVAVVVILADGTDEG